MSRYESDFQDNKLINNIAGHLGDMPNAASELFSHFSADYVYVRFSVLPDDVVSAAHKLPAKKAIVVANSGGSPEAFAVFAKSERRKTVLAEIARHGKKLNQGDRDLLWFRLIEKCEAKDLRALLPYVSIKTIVETWEIPEVKKAVDRGALTSLAERVIGEGDVEELSAALSNPSAYELAGAFLLRLWFRETFQDPNPITIDGALAKVDPTLFSKVVSYATLGMPAPPVELLELFVAHGTWDVADGVVAAVLDQASWANVPSDREDLFDAVLAKPGKSPLAWIWIANGMSPKDPCKQRPNKALKQFVAEVRQEALKKGEFSWEAKNVVHQVADVFFSNNEKAIDSTTKMLLEAEPSDVLNLAETLKRSWWNICNQASRSAVAAKPETSVFIDDLDEDILFDLFEASFLHRLVHEWTSGKLQFKPQPGQFSRWINHSSDRMTDEDRRRSLADALINIDVRDIECPWLLEAFDATEGWGQSVLINNSAFGRIVVDVLHRHFGDNKDAWMTFWSMRNQIGTRPLEDIAKAVALITGAQPPTEQAEPEHEAESEFSRQLELFV